MPHLDLKGQVVNEKSVEEGFELATQIFLPYFTPESKHKYQQFFSDSQWRAGEVS